MKIRAPKSRGQRGYILLSVMLLVTLMVLMLSIELPRISQQIKREKEEELIHRGNEYRSAIRKFFRKFGRYPLSIDQLENTNNMRFLRKRYKDPFTGKDDWRLLHPGEVQLNALNQTQAAPGQPAGQGISNIGQPTSFGTSGPASFAASATPQVSPGSIQPGGIQSAGIQPGGVQPAAQGDPSQNNAGVTPASGLPGAQGPGSFGTGAQPGMGPVIGVSSISKLESIKEINGKNHYNDWQFVYDPRLEQQTLQPGGQMGTNPVGGNTPGQFNPNGPGQPGQMGSPSITPPQSIQPAPRPQ